MKKRVEIVPERDEALVSKALQGDKSAFGQLVSRYEKEFCLSDGNGSSPSGC